jgi:hypothetical protein
MFITSIVVTILAAAGPYFLGYPRFHPLQADPHQHGESRRVGIVDHHTGNLESSRRARIADRIGVSAVGIAAAGGLVLFLSLPSSFTCADTTTRLVWRSCSFSWQSPRWGCEWFQSEEPDLIQLSIVRGGFVSATVDGIDAPSFERE